MLAQKLAEVNQWSLTILWEESPQTQAANNTKRKTQSFDNLKRPPYCKGCVEYMLQQAEYAMCECSSTAGLPDLACRLCSIKF